MSGFKSNFLSGKNILITGGGTGLGREMAITFSKLGARVSIISRKREVLEQTSRDIRKMGYEVEYEQCDVRYPDQIARAVENIEARTGSINSLVNNAAGNFISRTEDLSNKAFDTVIAIVLQGTVYFSMEMCKKWIKSNSGGVILNVVTTYSWTGSAYVVPSAVSKAGVLALTRSLAVEWGSRGIRSVAIAPGPFKTIGAWNNLVPTGEIEERMVSRNPMRRLGTTEEISELSAFLISDNASYINGEVVTIDGGEWLEGAGEFNALSAMPDEFWEALKSMRSKK